MEISAQLNWKGYDVQNWGFSVFFTSKMRSERLFDPEFFGFTARAFAKVFVLALELFFGFPRRRLPPFGLPGPRLKYIH
jgi:hypothetical protein